LPFLPGFSERAGENEAAVNLMAEQPEGQATLSPYGLPFREKFSPVHHRNIRYLCYDIIRFVKSIRTN
jgi:hypothetical protein